MTHDNLITCSVLGYLYTNFDNLKQCIYIYTVLLNLEYISHYNI